MYEAELEAEPTKAKNMATQNQIGAETGFVPCPNLEISRSWLYGRFSPYFFAEIKLWSVRRLGGSVVFVAI